MGDIWKKKNAHNCSLSAELLHYIGLLYYEYW